MTITADTEHASVAPSTDVAGQAAGTLLYVDPNLVEFEDNVRTDVAPTLTDEFIGSIQQYGVLKPVLGRVREDGTPLVRDGQRRVYGARAAGVLLPVFVRGTDDAKHPNTQRILEQINANQSVPLTDGDLAAAYKQLSLEGMNPTTIARRTCAKKRTVEAALVVAGHDTALRAVREHRLTLEQAAVWTEFDDDADALERLQETAAVHPEQFDHVAQRLADERARRAKLEAVADRYRARGVTVVAWPGWDDDTTAFLRELQSAEGQPLTEDGYAGKPGYAVAIRTSPYHHYDDHDEAGVEVEPVVVDWRAHGLRKVRSGAVKGKLTVEEKAQRRVVTANNSAWRSAEKVRRQWLTSWLGRRKLPADALGFAAGTLASHSHEITRAVGDGHRMTKTLLGLERTFDAAPLTALVARTPSKATHVTVALAVGALEAATDVHTWRSPSAAAIRYFAKLAEWGYPLSEVEQLVVADSSGNPAGDDPIGTPEDLGTPAGAVTAPVEPDLDAA